MAEIKTRPATPEYRENWDRIFGGFRTRVEGGEIGDIPPNGFPIHGSPLPVDDDHD